ncbi:methylmalonyl-CoA mutase family protein [Stomatohabitans albus]|uniref:methylmalonyl-CoA mutase family protein n=1 Tax=Stomatohabitans albus TaxID=3110766 RepID=UPI00300CBD30
MSENTPDNPSQVDHLDLAADFDAPTHEQWEVEVLKVLNRGRPEGKELNVEQAMKRLTHISIDGLVTKPLYLKDEDSVEVLGLPGQAPFTRGTTVRGGQADAWDIRQLHEDPDPVATNKAVLEDFERGATSVWLRIDDDAVKAEDLPRTLEGVIVDIAGIAVSSFADTERAAEALASFFEQSGADPDSLVGNLGVDPILTAALTGQEADLSNLKTWVDRTANWPGVTPLVVDGSLYHDMGATPAQEMAFTIATGIAYVRALVEQGVDVDTAFESILFRVSSTVDQFPTIARLRSLRLVWHRVGEVLGVTEEKRGARQHAITSWREISREDPYVNLLRGTIQCFAAAVGMAEIVTVLPFDTAYGLPNSFSRRMARNTQVILSEEANIGRVNDPAGGAWWVESHTLALAEKSWELIQAVEAEGGIQAYLSSGKLEADVQASVKERAKRLSTRKLGRTGVSEFPKVENDSLDRAPRPAPLELNGIERHRDAELFEAIRDRAIAAGQPNVFLACLGARRDFGGREMFTSNLVHVGAIQTVSHEGGTPEEIAAAFKENGSPMAILCSSAKVYASQAVDVANALKEAGAEKVLLAGNIKEIGDGDASVFDGTVAMGMDVVAFLNETLETLGVQ